MGTESVIKQTVDMAVDKANQEFGKKIDEKMGEFGMVEDKKQSIAKMFASSNQEKQIKGTSLKEDGVKKGHAFARMAKMKLQHKLLGTSQPLHEYMAETAEKHYSNNGNFVKMLKSPTMKGLLQGRAKDFNNVTNPQDGGYLVQEMYGDVVELLREKVFLFQAGARVTPMPNGNLNLPVHETGALSFFIGEGKKIKGKKQTFGNVKMSSKKQCSMAIFTNELIMDNSYEADQRFLDDIIREMAITMNFTALTGTGTEFTPRGIDNYPGVQKSDLDAVVDGDTASDLIGKIMGTNVAMEKGAFVMNGSLWSKFYNVTDGNGAYIFRDEMNRGTLNGFPFYLFNKISVGSTADKYTDIYFGDWNEFEVGEQKMFEVSMSNEATVYDENGEAIDLFAQDMTAVKVISFYDFAIRHPEGFAKFSKVKAV
jgi:HK97 family phage major capsid protein